MAVRIRTREGCGMAVRILTRQGCGMAVRILMRQGCHESPGLPWSRAVHPPGLEKTENALEDFTFFDCVPWISSNKVPPIREISRF